jgi:hypothetical protein
MTRLQPYQSTSTSANWAVVETSPMKVPNWALRRAMVSHSRCCLLRAVADGYTHVRYAHVTHRGAHTLRTHHTCMTHRGRLLRAEVEGPGDGRLIAPLLEQLHREGADLCDGM